MLYPVVLAPHLQPIDRQSQGPAGWPHPACTRVDGLAVGGQQPFQGTGPRSPTLSLLLPGLAVAELLTSSCSSQ